MIHHVNEEKPVGREQCTAYERQKHNFPFLAYRQLPENIAVLFQFFRAEKKNDDRQYCYAEKHAVKKNVERRIIMKRFERKTEKSPDRKSRKGGKVVPRKFHGAKEDILLAFADEELPNKS
jgi:hypothetical protein